MDLSTIVDVLSIIAVVSGLVFAGVELRQYRRSRERESALELFNTFQSPEFVRGIRTITLLPDNQSKQQVEDLVAERMDDLYFTIASLEGLGALVHKGEVNLDLVEDFFSGIVVVAWLKLRRYAFEERSSLGRETWLEWCQWLAERIMEKEEKEPVAPAYIEYQDWKPE